jgi:hypothetical protein
VFGDRSEGQLAVGELAELPADGLAGGRVSDPGGVVPAWLYMTLFTDAANLGKVCSDMLSHAAFGRRLSG